MVFIVRGALTRFRRRRGRVLSVSFWWDRRDSDSRAYRRTPLMSVAIVGVTIFALPYYLLRRRGFR
jgi:hypothetical protein